MKINKQSSAILLLAVALTFVSALPTSAAESANSSVDSGMVAPPSSNPTGELTTGSAPALGKVEIAGGSYFELKNVTMLTEQSGKTVSFTLGVNNVTNSDLLFIDYWVRMRTQAGNQISVKVLPQDKDKNRITPQSVQDISFYATVNDATELKDLIFEVIKWDFSEPNFERKLGEVAVPEDYSVLTPVAGSHTINMAGTQVKGSIKKVWMSKNEKNYSPTVVLNMENIGNRTALVPAYQFLLRTGEGYMYPLDAKSLKDLAINPQVNEEVELSGSIPIAVSTEGWQLVIIQNAPDLKLNLPIAYFELPQVSDPDRVDTGTEYNFSNKAGTYTSKLNSFQRLPWEDQDILTANLTLFNKGAEALPIPDLVGYYLLDDHVKVEAKLIKTDKMIGLPKGAEANFQFIGKMPYTYQFSTIKLILEEKIGETEKEKLLEFAHRSELLNMPYLNVGEIYKKTSVGRSASYKVLNVNTYSGDTADIFTVQMEAVNLEKRLTDVSKLVAQFKTVDGSVYPAVISEIKNKVGPGGSALLFLSSTLPKTFPTTNMHVMIGEAITEDKYTEKDAVPDAYVNAAAFWLPNENFMAQEDFVKVDLAPYQLTIGSINTWLDRNELRLTFDYELVKNMRMEANTEGRKLVFGFEDELGNKSFTKEYDFKDFDTHSVEAGTAAGAVSSDPAANDDKIRLGKKKEFKIIERDLDLIFHLDTLKTYKLSVYDSFQGQKKLLATKKIDWFSTTN
ncbi:hypothetical protein [Paenibacillus agricola]|uniref:Uncharacterized protein n=1 Tax=Paenibacillus agricola TaxID=2716264 RepID=A0ABX0J376_9BACL|nr:hypothetical protein [Paenibacillus agricola]NHN28571.1 hypothetical protein [Paenibacillus agricola]